MDKRQLEEEKVVPDKIDNKIQKVEELEQNNMDEITCDSAAGSCRNDSDNIDEPKGSINMLNRDCLAKVLMYLPVLERLEMEKVCQKWKEAIELSWYNVKKINFNDLMIPLDKKEETLNSILIKCGQYLTHLTMKTDCVSVCDVVKNTCRNLIHFDNNTFEDHETIPDENLLQMIMSMPKLKYLKLKIYRKQTVDIFNRILKVLPYDMEEIYLLTPNDIEQKEIIPYYNIASPVFLVLPDKFNCLRCLSLQGFILDDDVMESILLNIKTLVYLDLYDCQFQFDTSTSIFSNPNNLEYLNLNLVMNFNADIITEIVQNSSDLKYFKFSDSNEGCESEVIDISDLKYLNSLQHLDIPYNYLFRYDDNFIADITNNCQDIKHLNVLQGAYLSVNDFQHIIKLNNLEYLDLSSMRRQDEMILIKIMDNCLNLKGLNMDTNYIPAYVVRKLSNLKKLETIGLYRCENLTDNILINIASNCKNLVKLFLNRCDNVGETSFLQIGKLQHLEKLNIYHMANVPNAMFNDFCKLKELCCYNCPTVTDEGIIKVIDNCKNLSKLNIDKNGITVKTPIHASKRQFVYVILNIQVDKLVKDLYDENNIESPYLRVSVVAKKY